MVYSAEQIGKIIKKERKNRDWTQEELGDEINVSGKQISKYETGKTSPPVDILYKFCEIFDCDLGYLLGEKDYTSKTKLDTAIKSKYGLEKKSLEMLQKITGSKKNCLRFGNESEHTKNILNHLISSEKFYYFIEELLCLDESVRSLHSACEFDKLIEKYGQDLFNDAFSIYISEKNIEIESEEFNKNEFPLFSEVYKEISRKIGEQCEELDNMKYRRFAVFEIFISLLLDLYPLTRVNNPYI